MMIKVMMDIYLRPHNADLSLLGEHMTAYCIIPLFRVELRGRQAWREEGSPPPSFPSLPAFPLTLQLYDCSNTLQMKRGANPPEIIDKSSPRSGGIKIPRQTDSLCALGHPFK